MPAAETLRITSEPGLKLKMLRTLMSQRSPSVHAYLVPSVDSHQSEYISPTDRRLAFLSEFTGSRGLAAITLDKAALWTDGRYFVQANKQLDTTNWILMKEGQPATPTIADWLNQVLPSESRVGIDSRLFTKQSVQAMETILARRKNVIVGTTENLVDQIWADSRPQLKDSSLHSIPDTISGRSISEKIADLRKLMIEQNSGMLVLSSLDEIAWLFNLRASGDISFNPVFFSYAVLDLQSVCLFVNETRIHSTKLLLADQKGSVNVSVLDYGKFFDVIAARFGEFLRENAEKLIWIPGDSSSYALYSLLPDKRLCVDKASPVSLLKAVKNPVELQGMRDAQIKDAVAHCEFLHWLERKIAAGERVTEMEADTEFQNRRAQWPEYAGLSFDTISASGANGAIIHYKPTTATNAVIDANSLYLIDSGAQYTCGTTDITRTVAFTEPSPYQKECFTRVLQGHIKLARLKFPDGTHGSRIDAMARLQLWQVGLDYGHGTGHGVGHYLCVHEGPAGFGIRDGQYSEGVKENMILTIEPGYYEEENFGIRLESEYQTVTTETKYSTKDKKFLTFTPITFVPFDSKLMQVEILDQDEINWINEYHRKCLNVLSPLLKSHSKSDVLQWLEKACREI